MNVPSLQSLELDETPHAQRRFAGVVAILNNALLDEIWRRQATFGPIPRGGAGPVHKWKVTVSRARTAGTWRVFTGSGCVNDEMAAILYERENDPRGWVMPENYGPFRKLARVFGEGYPVVDRPLNDPRDPPHCLLTAPDANEHDLGGFEAVPDRSRPEVFRTKAMWEKKLYRAHVVVAASPFFADPQQVGLRIGGQVQKRWRVHAGKLPVRVAASGVTALDFKELARLYLVRTPGHPEADKLQVQQLTFWSMQGRSAIPQTLVDLAAAIAETSQALDLALLGLGAGGIAFATGLLSIQALLTEIFLANLENTLAESSSVEFWSV